MTTDISIIDIDSGDYIAAKHFGQTVQREDLISHIYLEGESSKTVVQSYRVIEIEHRGRHRATTRLLVRQEGELAEAGPRS
jgi:hypothetical protein